MKKLLLVLLAAVTCLTFAGYRASAFDLFSNCVTESDGTKVCGPCATDSNSPSCTQATNQGSDTTNRINGTGNLINIAANILAVAAGAAAVIMIIISALTLATSGGNAEEVKGARRRLAYSLIGLVVVALAWTITRFITDRLIQ